MLEAALDALPAGDSPTRARLLARLGQEVVFGPSGDRHHRLTADGVAMARRLGDRAALGDALAARANAIFADPAFSDEWVADTAELLALARDLGDPNFRGYAAWQRFAADGKEMLSGERRWDLNHLGFQDFVRDPVTGRRTLVGDCLWSQPYCADRIRVARALFQGGLRPRAARRFVRVTGARFVVRVLVSTLSLVPKCWSGAMRVPCAAAWRRICTPVVRYEKNGGCR